MDIISTISATLTSLSITSKFIKNSIDKIKDNAIREKIEELLNAIIPLQTAIMTLQEMNFTCIKEKETLEKKLMESENWDKEASRYELKELASGVYVYGIKETAKSSEPFHYLCARCYNEQKKSILQQVQHSDSGIYYVCQTCSSQILDSSKPKSASFQKSIEWDDY